MIGGFVMAGRKGMKHYPDWMKYEALRLFEVEGKTKREIMELLGVNDKDRIKVWFRQIRNERAGNGAALKQKGRPRKSPRTAQREMELQVNRLKMENELLRSFLLEVERG